MADISALLDQHIFDPIDPNVVEDVITKSPFIPIPGVLNFRDLGGLPVVDPNSNDVDPNLNSGLRVREGRLFRSAQLNAVTPEGKAILFELDIGAVFDFRDEREIRREARLPADVDIKLGLPELKRPKGGETNVPDDIASIGQGETEEIKIYQNPLKDITEYAPQDMMKLITRMGRGDDGMVELYEEFLKDGGKSFGNIMRFILEKAKKDASPEQDTNAWRGTACLCHCHIGKDRTGIFSALVLNLLGVPDSVIAHDYALTRIGLEPMRTALEIQFKDLKAANKEAAGTFGSSRAVVMMRFLEILKTKHGGARGYFKEYSGLTDDELNIIRSSLVERKEE